MSGFWKPGAARPGSSLDKVAGNEEGVFVQTAHQSDSAGQGISGQRASLPIAKQRDSILYLLERHSVLIVVGQTGSGKTTQIPQYLMEAGWTTDARQVVITQPRRMSAVAVAQRVAHEVGSVLGEQVGYTIRFEDVSNERQTCIKYCTDGVLFRECMRDPLLSRYSVIMVDEAHERSAYTDLLLGLLKKIKRKRPELRIVISSATIDAALFADFFEDTTLSYKDNTSTAVLSLEAKRTHPIEIAYLDKSCNDYVTAAVEAVWNIHLTQPAGHILVFLTGREEITDCMQALFDRVQQLRTGSLSLQLLPLHAGLSTEEQAEIFQLAPRDTRKCIVATNIAETSVTIEGIKYVIDCGLVKQRLFDPTTGMESLSTMPISKASATQRAGRAGRTSAGKCLRLYTEATFESLAPTTSSELGRTDLSKPVLQLKALGIDNLVKFDYLPPAPPSALLAQSLESLSSLGAIDSFGRLTQPLGEQMAEFPLDAKMAKVVLESVRFQCTQEILTIAAMTSVSSPFIIPDEGRSDAGLQGEVERRKFTAEEGDHLTLLNVYNAFVHPHTGKQSPRWCSSHKLNFRVLSRAVNIRAQLENYLARFGVVRGGESCQGDGVRLRKCLASGYFAFAARMRDDGSYTFVRDQTTTLYVHPSSVLFSRSPQTKWVIFQEVVETQKRFMRELSVIEEDWLLEVAPHFYRR